MGDLEKFANSDRVQLPDLLKIALLHYQFETIHPFLDGNGRVGRLLITYYLVDRGVLQQPVLYLSDYLERNRQQYYDQLTAVRRDGALTAWLHFFLDGVIETARSGVETFNGILKLQETLRNQLQHLGSRYHRADALLNHMFVQPIIRAEQVTALLEVAPSTAYRLLKELTQLGILKEISGNERRRQYGFTSYLDLFRKPYSQPSK